MDDSPASTSVLTAGSLLSTSSSTVATIGPGGGSDGHFFRLGGTMVVHKDTAVTTVVFDLFLDDRGGAGICLFRGTAVPS
jgi:hypothetical protein